MKTRFKLVFMSIGVTLLMTVGMTAVTLYTTHQGANLRKTAVTGPKQSALETLATQNPNIIAERAAVQPSNSDSTAPRPDDPSVSSPKQAGAYDNGQSPLDDPSKVIANMGVDNPALLKGKPAFLRH